jgi:hypothetical protein
MLLGIPSAAQVQKNIDPAYRHFYWAAFLNDDWKITPRLTLNFGLRRDLETSRIERYDRMVKGLDLDAASPIADRVQSLNLKGPVLFAGVDGQSRRAFNLDKNNWQPRFGAAFKVGDKWVFRAPLVSSEKASPHCIWTARFRSRINTRSTFSANSRGRCSTKSDMSAMRPVDCR